MNVSLGAISLDFGILSKFDCNMATTNNTRTTAKKVIKGSPYKWTPETS